jgi:hypothetical protein
MFKKIVVGGILCIVVSSALSAQNTKHFALTIDPIPFFAAPLLDGFGAGGSFEWRPWGGFSLRASAYYLDINAEGIFALTDNTGTSVKFTLFKANASARYYFAHALESFFLDLGAGWVNLTGDVNNGKSTVNMVKLSFGAGYKLLFSAGNVREAFFIEPTLLYNTAIPIQIGSTPAPRADWGTATLLGLAGLGLELTIGFFF